MVLVAGACVSEEPGLELDVECARGDPAPSQCAQGDPKTHVCTDGMWDPSCVDGHWTCGDGDVRPEPEIDCWCHVGPWPWPESWSLCTCRDEGPRLKDGLTCQFHCGPSLLCTVGDAYCEQRVSDVMGEEDAFQCAPFAAGIVSGSCEAVPSGFSSCEQVENGGTLAIYPSR
jgi:hypothetical protein